jgi:hypothetical protein
LGRVLPLKARTLVRDVLTIAAICENIHQPIR